MHGLGVYCAQDGFAEPVDGAAETLAGAETFAPVEVADPALSPEEADGASDAAGVTALSDLADGAGFLLWSLKSVTYHPVPLRAKPAAVSCLARRG